MKNIFRQFLLFLIGGISYYLLEILYRGYSHWTMAIVGGICFMLIGRINNCLDWNMSLIKQCLLGAIIVTVIEFCSGIIINKVFLLNVWDYSKLKYNLFGQISLFSSLLWIPTSLLTIIVDDFIRFKLFKEQKPHYEIF